MINKARPERCSGLGVFLVRDASQQRAGEQRFCEASLNEF